jgi:hypothetical protein
MLGLVFERIDGIKEQKREIMIGRGIKDTRKTLPATKQPLPVEP